MDLAIETVLFRFFTIDKLFISKLPILGHPFLDGRQQAPV